MKDERPMGERNRWGEHDEHVFNGVESERVGEEPLAKEGYLENVYLQWNLD